ncbi:rubredoxin [Pseudodesulfovibrio hydrargyri]|uniref:rubredoxin n=1 Tax=Pseudodesulfovibrio hydrargyri TaxID=2125990 RepID=UPI0009FF433F|nr:rubredoxin [Pseudodesulfovibrio hydrargyri]
MGTYICLVCGYEYQPPLGDPESDIPPNTDFQTLPGDWACPECGAEKSNFVAEAG